MKFNYKDYVDKLETIIFKIIKSLKLTKIEEDTINKILIEN